MVRTGRNHHLRIVAKTRQLDRIPHPVMAHPFLDQIRQLVGDIDFGGPQIECKHFFSGAAVYANGKIVASLSPKGLAFKLSEPRCAAVLSDGLAIPLRYFDNSPVKQRYVLFPDKSQLGQVELENFFRESVLTGTATMRPKMR